MTQTAAGRLLSRPMSHLLCQGCSRDLGDQTWTGACPYCGATRVMRVADSDEALTGRVVAGRFRIVRKLGQGGMGRVFLAEQLELGQQVALKFLNVGISRDVELARRFLQEARNAARVAHPNAVAVHDFGQDEDGNLFLAMEYVEGVDLRRHLDERGSLSTDEAGEIALQAADVLAHAHARGVVHRDLKPENVMLRPGIRGLHVKLLDFGIAKLIDDSATRATAQGVMIGTPRHMAPEQIEGGAIDARTDVYALGLLLFEMRTGRPAVEAGSMSEVMHRQLTQSLPPLGELAPELADPALDAVIARATAKRPEARFPDMESFARELSATLRRASSEEARPRWKAVRTVGIAAVAVVAAGIAVMTLWSGPREKDAERGELEIAAPQDVTPVEPAPVPVPPLPAAPQRVDAGGFSFRLPDGWIDLSPSAPAENFARVPAALAAQAHAPGAVVYAVAPALSGLYWPRLRVELFANPESVTPERLQSIANSIMKLLEGVPGAKPRLIAVDAIEIAGAAAGRILVGLQAPAGPELRLLSFLVAGREHDALLSFDTSAEQFDGLQPLLEAAAADTQPRSSAPSH